MPDKPRVLIIDDDADYRESTRALLESAGYEVSEAASGREGLALAQTHLPNLIIVDIMMESLSEGYSVVQALKFSRDYRHLANVPILMVSSVQVDPATLFGWIGDTSWITPDDYLTKPLDVAKFLTRVRELLGQ